MLTILTRYSPETISPTGPGEAGDIQQALRLSTALAPDQERVLGAYHHETLRTLRNIAHWTGMLGDVPGATRHTSFCYTNIFVFSVNTIRTR